MSNLTSAVKKQRASGSSSSTKADGMNEAIKEDMTTLHFNIPVSLKKQFKGMAHERDDKMTDLLVSFIQGYVGGGRYVNM